MRRWLYLTLGLLVCLIMVAILFALLLSAMVAFGAFDGHLHLFYLLNILWIVPAFSGLILLLEYLNEQWYY